VPFHRDDAIFKKLLENLGHKVFNDIYIPMAHIKSGAAFKTYVDIKLKTWAEQTLPSESVEVGNTVLKQEFVNLMKANMSSKTHDDLLDNLLNFVVNEAWKKYIWEPKALNILVCLKKQFKFKSKSDHCFCRK